jgi:glycosyltransferase involved in cell wall biosynthesis
MMENSKVTQLSGIVVVGRRKDDLRAIANEYWTALKATKRIFELIFVVDGNQRAVVEELKKVICVDKLPIKIIQLARPFGDATALMCGVDQATGETILTLPAYYQVDPEELPGLIDKFVATDVLVVRRYPRRGGMFENFRRKSFHKLLQVITGDRFSDLGCYVRILNRKVLKELRLYGDQHRFLPVLARNAGFAVTETKAKQSEHDHFRAHYRMREYLHRILDIFTIFFLIRFTKKPLRFFGMIGSLTGVVGGIILAVLVFQRLFLGEALADRPAMLLSSLLVVLGLQLFSLGLLGELIIFTHAHVIKEYKIAEIIGADSPNYRELK